MALAPVTLFRRVVLWFCRSLRHHHYTINVITGTVHENSQVQSFGIMASTPPNSSKWSHLVDLKAPLNRNTTCKGNYTGTNIRTFKQCQLWKRTDAFSLIFLVVCKVTASSGITKRKDSLLEWCCPDLQPSTHDVWNNDPMEIGVKQFHMSRQQWRSSGVHKSLEKKNTCL